MNHASHCICVLVTFKPSLKKYPETSGKIGGCVYFRRKLGEFLTFPSFHGFCVVLKSRDMEGHIKAEAAHVKTHSDFVLCFLLFMFFIRFNYFIS